MAERNLNQITKTQTDKANSVGVANQPQSSSSQYRTLNLFWRIVVVLLAISGLFLAINTVFLLGLVEELEYQNAFIYSLMAVLLPIAFLVFPSHKNSSKTSIPWYDVVLGFMCFVIPGYLATISYEITHKGWDFVPPLHVGITACLLCLLVLEVTRRAAGMGMFITCAIFSIYPVVAGHMPGFMRGIEFSIYQTAVFHALGRGSLLGIATDVFGSLLIGFMLFGVVLVVSGGGKFFLNLAFSLFGTQRGGPAKVAVFASCLFGSISGSAIANVVTTGTITIPTMKKAGYPPHYAAAIEACASCGGCVMPPIMGSVAFLMAAWLGVPYFQVALAALIPGLLYFCFGALNCHVRSIALW